MQANQKLEAEAGALRALLLELLALNASEAGLPIAESRFACPEFCDKIRATLAVTDAGKEVAERITGYQEQLQLNTRLIELLRDHRTSLAAQNRVLAPTAETALHMLAKILDARTVAIDIDFYRNQYYGLKEDIAKINAHKYADLLSMAVTFNIGRPGLGPHIEVHWEGGWGISKFVDYSGHKEFWDHTAADWGGYDHRLKEHFTFPTLEAAFAYVEDHPAVLGLQLIDNAPNSVLDNAQPHR